MFIKPIKIGNIALKNNIFLAPMAGITDKAFRTITDRYSEPGLKYTEMASSRAIHYNDEKTDRLIDTNGEKRPIAIQIFGSDPDIMARAATMIEKDADIIDINMGCPAPKVVKNGDGSKLLTDLPLAEKILYEVVHAVEVPVTVKIRTGWSQESIVACEVAKVAERAGISAITVHGRTRKQYYSGQVDFETIRKVKESVNIPVIGNGDIKSVSDANRMFEMTGVDGIMIGRGSIGNPWLLKEIIEGKEANIDKDEKLNAILEHLSMLVEQKGEYIGIREMRKYICYYTKNMKNSAELRQRTNSIETREEVEKTLREFFSL